MCLYYVIATFISETASQDKSVPVAVLYFRVDISDTLMYVYEMLGAELLSNLYDRLGRHLMDPQQSEVWQVRRFIADSFKNRSVL